MRKTSKLIGTCTLQPIKNYSKSIPNPRKTELQNNIFQTIFDNFMSVLLSIELLKREHRYSVNI